MREGLHLTIDGGIATLRLDSPGASVNTVSEPWIEEMTSLFERVRDDDAITGVIVASGKDSFMAGADLHKMLEAAGRMDAAEAFAFSQRATRMHRLIETCGKPVVAAMNGFALGGGYELALACTRRILADDPAALVGLPEVTVGLLPGSGGTQRLARMIGLQKAARVLLDGKRYPPAEALATGLVDAVVPAAELLDAARKWLAISPDPVRPWDSKGFRPAGSGGLLDVGTAQFFTAETARLLARHGANHPAPLAILTCLFEGIQVPIDKGLKVESRHFARLLTSPVARNIIRTGFVHRGLARKGARQPQGVAERPITRVGVVGAGMMGRGIAYVAAARGLDVILVDRDVESADAGHAKVREIAERAVRSGRLSDDKAGALSERISASADYEDLSTCDIVIEAVFEDEALKHEVLKRIEREVRPDVLIASNTSTLPITGLSSALVDPTRFLGLHFFSPVERMELVELITWPGTSSEGLALGLGLIARLGKTPITVRDGRGFYTSRVFQTFIHEGLELLLDGVAPALIENAARNAGMPVGPLAVLDEVTLDLPLRIVGQAEAADADFARPRSAQVLEKMIGLGRSGRKAGGGFYEYGGASKSLWRGLADCFPRRADQPGPVEVTQRLLYVQSIETMRCLEDGILRHPADGDLGSVLGWGFPSWTGGTLSLIETVGPRTFVARCDDLAERHGERFRPPAALREMAEADRGFDWS